MRQLQDDAPGVALWPDAHHDPATGGCLSGPGAAVDTAAAPVADERVAFAPRWLISWLTSGEPRTQLAWDRSMQPPPTVFGHMLWYPLAKVVYKPLAKMLYGWHNWTHSEQLGAPSAAYFAQHITQAGAPLGTKQPPPRLLVLAAPLLAALPPANMIAADGAGGSAARLRLLGMLRALTQLAVVTGRAVAWPALGCGGLDSVDVCTFNSQFMLFYASTATARNLTVNFNPANASGAARERTALCLWVPTAEQGCLTTEPFGLTEPEVAHRLRSLPPEQARPGPNNTLRVSSLLRGAQGAPGGAGYAVGAGHGGSGDGGGNGGGGGGGDGRSGSDSSGAGGSRGASDSFDGGGDDGAGNKDGASFIARQASGPVQHHHHGSGKLRRHHQPPGHTQAGPYQPLPQQPHQPPQRQQETKQQQLVQLGTAARLLRHWLGGLLQRRLRYAEGQLDGDVEAADDAGVDDGGTDGAGSDGDEGGSGEGGDDGRGGTSELLGLPRASLSAVQQLLLAVDPEAPVVWVDALVLVQELVGWEDAGKDGTLALAAAALESAAAEPAVEGKAPYQDALRLFELRERYASFCRRCTLLPRLPSKRCLLEQQSPG